jgi:hypothetical protein
MRRKMKGMGRVRFEAEEAEIWAELAAKWPIKASWEKRRRRLGISYRQFYTYARELRQKAEPQPRSPAHPVPSSKEGGPQHAERQPQPTGGGADHNPVADQDILGPGFLKRR